MIRDVRPMINEGRSFQGEVPDHTTYIDSILELIKAADLENCQFPERILVSQKYNGLAIPSGIQVTRADTTSNNVIINLKPNRKLPRVMFRVRIILKEGQEIESIIAQLDRAAKNLTSSKYWPEDNRYLANHEPRKARSKNKCPTPTDAPENQAKVKDLGKG